MRDSRAAWASTHGKEGWSRAREEVAAAQAVEAGLDRGAATRRFGRREGSRGTGIVARVWHKQRGIFEHHSGLRSCSGWARVAVILLYLHEISKDLSSI